MFERYACLVPKKKVVETPAVGSAYMFPLEGGRFGLCRIVREASDAERAMNGPGVIIATSSWIGTEPPALTDPALRQTLRRTHHSWKDAPDLCWVDDAPPDTYRYLGIIPPDAADRRTRCHTYGGWSCDLQRLLQWRWDHDRDALLAGEAEEARRAAEASATARASETKRRAALTWPKLRAKKRFKPWKRELRVAGEALFVRAVDALAALGPKEKRKARAAIKALVAGFNALDEIHSFIETIEREEICEEISELAFLAGLPPDIADDWRDW